MSQWPEALEEFRQVYNQRRPHEALAMQRPVERYRAMLCPYKRNGKGAPLGMKI